MALPRPQDTYEDYTDQLVYFGARLAANPLVAALAPQVDALVDQLDAEHEALRAAHRAEVRARARRDHEDAGSDEASRRSAVACRWSRTITSRSAACSPRA